MLKKKHSNAADAKIQNLINEGCKIEGMLVSDSFIRIDGVIEGNVDIGEGAIIGDKGLITGDIRTKSLIIYGMVNGNIDSHSLEIKSTGCVNGKINTSKLHVEFGGVYNGQLTMGKTDIKS